MSQSSNVLDDIGSMFELGRKLVNGETTVRDVIEEAFDGPKEKQTPAAPAPAGAPPAEGEEKVTAPAGGLRVIK